MSKKIVEDQPLIEGVTIQHGSRQCTFAQSKKKRGTWLDRPAECETLYIDGSELGRRVVVMRYDDGQVDVHSMKGDGRSHSQIYSRVLNIRASRVPEAVLDVAEAAGALVTFGVEHGGRMTQVTVPEGVLMGNFRRLVEYAAAGLIEGSAEHPDVVIMVDMEYGDGRFRVYEHGVDRSSIRGWSGVQRWLDTHSHEEAWVLFQRVARPFGYLVIQAGNFTGERLRIPGGAVHPEARDLLQ